MQRCACVFICLSTGAIHLEMVYSLNTDSCLSAITHFIATPIDNNVTNFVGAVTLGNHRGKLVTYIVWKFNLAAAPHFGGSLERMLKTCKQAAIYYVLKGQCHTDELLAIILCLTEELLNARPLFPMIQQTWKHSRRTNFGADRVSLFLICQMRRSFQITRECSVWLRLTWTTCGQIG